MRLFGTSFFNRYYQITKKLLDDWNDMNLSTCNTLKNVVPWPPRFVKTSANLSGLVTRSFQKISASELVNTTRGRCLYELFWWSRAHLKALWQKAWEIYILGIDCFWFGFKESRWFSKFESWPLQNNHVGVHDPSPYSAHHHCPLHFLSTDRRKIPFWRVF